MKLLALIRARSHALGFVDSDAQLYEPLKAQALATSSSEARARTSEGVLQRLGRLTHP